MAQIIAFPGTTLPKLPRPSRKKVEVISALPKVVTIRGRGRVPKKNRDEDRETAMIARLAASWADRAHNLAQTEPGSKDHSTAVHMSGIGCKLPCNNLRLFTTPDDVVEGLWRAVRRVDVAHAEWNLIEVRRTVAICDGDREAIADLGDQEKEADAKLWLEYERMIRVPATGITQFNERKMRQWGRGVGNIEWMRQHKPDLAAVLDDERERLTALLDEKRARCASKPQRKREV